MSEKSRSARILTGRMHWNASPVRPGFGWLPATKICRTMGASARSCRTLVSAPVAFGDGSGDERRGEREGVSRRVRLMMKLRRDRPGGFSYSIGSVEFGVRWFKVQSCCFGCSLMPDALQN